MADIESEGFGTLHEEPVSVTGSHRSYQGIVWGHGPVEVHNAAVRAGLFNPASDSAIHVTIGASGGYGEGGQLNNRYGTQVTITGRRELFTASALVEAGHKLASFCIDEATK